MFELKSQVLELFSLKFAERNKHRKTIGDSSWIAFCGAARKNAATGFKGFVNSAPIALFCIQNFPDLCSEYIFYSVFYQYYSISINFTYIFDLFSSWPPAGTSSNRESPTISTTRMRKSITLIINGCVLCYFSR